MYGEQLKRMTRAGMGSARDAWVARAWRWCLRSDGAFRWKRSHRRASGPPWRQYRSTCSRRCPTS